MTRKLVTWLGEDDLHFRVTDDGTQEPVPGPSYTTWRHDDVFIKFEKNVPVLIDDDPTLMPTLALRQQILRKVDGMPSRFKVENLPDEDEDKGKTKGANAGKPDITVEKTLKETNRPDDPPPTKEEVASILPDPVNVPAPVKAKAKAPTATKA